MVNIGQEIPDLEVDAYHEDEVKPIKLSDYRGKWLVLLFYPADFTFVCPTELEDAASLYGEFQQIDAEILSVSTDTAFVHKAWHDTSEAIGKVEYPMVADPTGALSRAFGVYIEDAGLALRGTFVIDPDGVLKTAEVHDLGIGRSARELLRKVQAAQFVRENGDQVCPANWEPGAATLKPGLDLVGKI
jgi:peroxiredoxin (alkyl hydroperoxide reductase subunit C)